MTKLGQVLSVVGSQMTVDLDGKTTDGEALRVGTVVKVPNGDRQVLGSISEVNIGQGEGASHYLVADLLGEIVAKNGSLEFTRGVSIHPVPGAAAHVAGEAELIAVYGEPSSSNVPVGTIYQDPSRPAYVMTNKLLGKHFAVLGSTGSGKSCALTVILSAILAKHPQAHILLLDPHNEYTEAFGDLADVVNVENLRLPLWVLDFAEASRLLIRSGSDSEQQSQALILKDAMMAARRAYNPDDPNLSSITVDTPVPFRTYELLRSINEQMGRLSKPDTAFPYLRLRERIQSLLNDPRFRFFFATEDDILEESLPICSGYPSAASRFNFESLRRSVRSDQRRGLDAEPDPVQLRHLVGARGDAAGAAGVRGGATVRAGRREPRLLRNRSDHHPDRQGGP